MNVDDVKYDMACARLFRLLPALALLGGGGGVHPDLPGGRALGERDRLGGALGRHAPGRPGAAGGPRPAAPGGVGLLTGGVTSGVAFPGAVPFLLGARTRRGQDRRARRVRIWRLTAVGPGASGPLDTSRRPD